MELVIERRGEAEVDEDREDVGVGLVLGEVEAVALMLCVGLPEREEVGEVVVVFDDREERLEEAVADTLFEIVVVAEVVRVVVEVLEAVDVLVLVRLDVGLRVARGDAVEDLEAVEDRVDVAEVVDVRDERLVRVDVAEGRAVYEAMAERVPVRVLEADMVGSASKFARPRSGPNGSTYTSASCVAVAEPRSQLDPGENEANESSNSRSRML